MNAYNKEKEELGKTLLEEEIAIKAMTRFVKNLEGAVNRLKTEKSLFKKTNKNPAFGSSMATTSSGQIIDKLLKLIPPVYLGFAVNTEKAVLWY